MKTFTLFFALQFLLFLLVTVKYRAVAQARDGWTIATDMLISAAQFCRPLGTMEKVISQRLQRSCGPNHKESEVCSDSKGIF
jgi:hypothetical protein